MSEIETFLQQLDETERLTAAASSSRQGSTPTGERWQWECSNCDTSIKITPVTILDEVLQCPNCESYGVDLRSVEQYEYEVGSGYRSSLPHLVTHSCEEVAPVDGAHIAEWSPRRALSWVAAVREILRVHLPVDGVCQTCSFDEESDRSRSRDYPENESWPCPTVRALMSVYQEEGS